MSNPRERFLDRVRRAVAEGNRAGQVPRLPERGQVGYQGAGPDALACFCQAAASLMDAGLYVRRRTGLKLGVTLSATAVMLLLYAVLIPRYRSMGAAVVNIGNPVAESATVGNCGGDVLPLDGYSLVSADDLDAALAMAKGCPLVSRGGGVEVGSLLDLPG